MGFLENSLCALCEANPNQIIMGPEVAFFLLIWVSSLLQLKWVVFFGCFNGFFVVYFAKRQLKKWLV